MFDPYDIDARTEIVESIVDLDGLDIEQVMPQELYDSILSDYIQQRADLFYEQGDETYADDEKLDDLNMVICEEIETYVKANLERLGVKQ